MAEQLTIKNGGLFCLGKLDGAIQETLSQLKRTLDGSELQPSNF
jgi:hypothetical protein